MSVELAKVMRLEQAAGRRLLRVGVSGIDEIELVFERQPGEHAELLVTFMVGELSVGEIDLAAVESMFGRQYGLGIPA